MQTLNEPNHFDLNQFVYSGCLRTARWWWCCFFSLSFRRQMWFLFLLRLFRSTNSVLGTKIQRLHKVQLNNMHYSLNWCRLCLINSNVLTFESQQKNMKKTRSTENIAWFNFKKKIGSCRLSIMLQRLRTVDVSKSKSCSAIRHTQKMPKIKTRWNKFCYHLMCDFNCQFGFAIPTNTWLLYLHTQQLINK